MIDASWIIADRTTGKAVLETYNFETLQFINLQRYKVYTIRAWLARVQRTVNAGESWVQA
jgi:hypothetical protein